MKVAIWGAGAVGIGLASALARPGEQLPILGRNPETCKALRDFGIRRMGLFGDHVVPPEQLRVETDPARLSEDPPDWLLICTKAFATTSVAEAIAPFTSRLAEKTRLVLCQNGWGNEAPFLTDWPKDRVFHARVITGFHRRRPHEVEITAHAAPIALGSVTGAPIGSLESLAQRMSDGGLPTEVVRDMRAVLWGKMLYNCALNPLGALVGQRYGALTENPATRAIVEEVIREIFGVLAAASQSVSWPDADAYLTTFHQQLIPPTKEHESSMLQDLRAGRPTEIEALCGAVERMAAEVGVDTPVVSALAALVRVAETRSAA